MTPIAHLSRRYRFSASHRLHVDALSPERNAAIYGKCNNAFGHGHNYIVQITLSSRVDANTGMIVDLASLDAFAKRELLDRFDHSNLNTLDCFRDLVPTTENLCREVWSIFAQFPHARLERVRVEETDNNAFEYFGESVTPAREE
jgi:6-pyruvoyltetrahydropterin/6-carboxytetrahydropterin synthase